MRNHWRTLIQQASRTQDVPGFRPRPPAGPRSRPDDEPELDPALRIARDTIRLARLAAAAHLAMAPAHRRNDAGPPANEGGSG